MELTARAAGGMPRRRGLFCDLDGTLADTLPSLRKAYDAFLGRFGIVGDHAEFEALNGPPFPIVVERLRDRYRLPGESAEHLDFYIRLAMEAHGTSGPMRGGAGLLRRAREAGWATAIVTSAGREGARAWLGAHRLLDLVDLVVGGDDVCKGKPDPAPYRLAIERLGCSADLSCAVEDSPQGSTAALGAGLRTFVLGADPVRWRGPAGVDFVQTLAEIGAELR